MRSPLRLRLLLSLLALIAMVRGLALVGHDPLLALANNYDQIRYSSCLDLAPWRPGVPPDRGNPQAPLARYAFQPLPAGTCVWTSDLVFTAPVALAWRLGEALGARAVHSIRRLGEWRLLGWWLVAAWATCAFLRERRAGHALAYLALFALVAMDPANLLYLPTFYAEAAAAFAALVCISGIAVALVRPTRVALGVAALGAALLATAKFQHLVLPLLLGGALFAAGAAARRVAFAVVAGGLVGLPLQLAGMQHATRMAHSIGVVNRADFLLTVLLPESDDRARVVARLGLEPACVAYAGRSVYAMPGPVEQTCTHADRWSRAELWWLLVSDPPALARALAHVPRLLLPWIPGLGQVEGGHYAPLPSTIPSLGAAFGARPALALALLLLPWLVLAGAAAARAPTSARAFALTCASGSSAVALTALFGDGDVELAKHAHLAVDFSLASLGVPLAALAARIAPAPPPAERPA
ncbi:MAG TPA: hypothetical protein VGC30_10050 [Dokdonella sp.]